MPPTGLEAASYNAQGLPEAMVLEGGKTLRYRYSAGGQRTYKQMKGQAATHYIRDGSATVGVVEGGSMRYWNLTLPGGEVIGRALEGGDRRYYLKDHLGSVRAVVDGGGNVKETRDYYPFGLPMPGRYDKGSPPTQEDFTGHVKDESTGLHYAGARYYSSAFGRWTTTDPILGEKGPKALLKQDARLLTMTSYNYAFGTPTTLIDPMGLAPLDDFYITRRDDGSVSVRQVESEGGPEFHYVGAEGEVRDLSLANRDDAMTIGAVAQNSKEFTAAVVEDARGAGADATLSQFGEAVTLAGAKGSLNRATTKGGLLLGMAAAGYTGAAYVGGAVGLGNAGFALGTGSTGLDVTRNLSNGNNSGAALNLLSLGASGAGGTVMKTARRYLTPMQEAMVGGSTFVWQQMIELATSVGASETDNE